CVAFGRVVQLGGGRTGAGGCCAARVLGCGDGQLWWEQVVARRIWQPIPIGVRVVEPTVEEVGHALVEPERGLGVPALEDGGQLGGGRGRRLQRVAARRGVETQQ